MNEAVAEFSRLLHVARLSPNGIEETLSAKPEERMALARRFDLMALDDLRAQLLVLPGLSQRIKVTGRVEADITQHCVVTLEPLSTQLRIDIDVTFIPEEELQTDIEGDAEGPYEDVETYRNGRLDLGELVAQQMGVAIDPYPRKAGATLKIKEFGPPVEKSKPLARLAEVAKNKDRTSD